MCTFVCVQPEQLSGRSCGISDCIASLGSLCPFADVDINK